MVSAIAPTAALAVGMGVAIGYGAHVAADACTPSGVPFFAPLSGQRWWLLPPIARIPTGSVREFAIATAAGVTGVVATVLLAA